MLSGLLDIILGDGLQLVLLLLGLLPTVDVESFGLAVTPEVSNFLGVVNFFIPIGDLISILTVWVGLLLAANVALFVQRAFALFKS